MNGNFEVLQNLQQVSYLKNLLTDNENIAFMATEAILVFKKHDENRTHNTSQYKTLYPYVCLFASHLNYLFHLKRALRCEDIPTTLDIIISNFPTF